MARVKCDSCGDEHGCTDAPTPAAAGKTGKPKRALHPAMVARNAAAAKAKAEREAKGTTTIPATHVTSGAAKPKSIVRELLGF